MNAHFQKILEEMRNGLEQVWGRDTVTEQGSSGNARSQTESHPGDELDLYLASMADDIRQVYGESAESAVEIIFEGIDEMTTDGLIPELPQTGSEADVAAWLKGARSAGLQGYIMRMAKDV